MAPVTPAAFVAPAADPEVTPPADSYVAVASSPAVVSPAISAYPASSPVVHSPLVCSHEVSSPTVVSSSEVISSREIFSSPLIISSHAGIVVSSPGVSSTVVSSLEVASPIVSSLVVSSPEVSSPEVSYPEVSSPAKPSVVFTPKDSTKLLHVHSLYALPTLTYPRKPIPSQRRTVKPKVTVKINSPEKLGGENFLLGGSEFRDLQAQQQALQYTDLTNDIPSMNPLHSLPPSFLIPF